MTYQNSNIEQELTTFIHENFTEVFDRLKNVLQSITISTRQQISIMTTYNMIHRERDLQNNFPIATSIASIQKLLLEIVDGKSMAELEKAYGKIQSTQHETKRRCNIALQRLS